MSDSPIDYITSIPMLVHFTQHPSGVERLEIHVSTSFDITLLRHIFKPNAAASRHYSAIFNRPDATAVPTFEPSATAEVPVLFKAYVPEGSAVLRSMDTGEAWVIGNIEVCRIPSIEEQVIAIRRNNP